MATTAVTGRHLCHHDAADAVGVVVTGCSQHCTQDRTSSLAPASRCCSGSCCAPVTVAGAAVVVVAGAAVVVGP